MGWGAVDDGLHSHVKWRRASKGARSLWTTALSWCSDQGNGGHVPADMLAYLDGTRADARSLVSVGLWVADGADWRFHQWDERNPDAASVSAAKTAKSKGGKEGAHVRWHTRRGVVAPDCEWCQSA
mgnify:CR=1 FL=1